MLVISGGRGFDGECPLSTTQGLSRENVQHFAVRIITFQLTIGTIRLLLTVKAPSPWVSASPSNSITFHACTKPTIIKACLGGRPPYFHDPLPVVICHVPVSLSLRKVGPGSLGLRKELRIDGPVSLRLRKALLRCQLGLVVVRTSRGRGDDCITL